MPSSRPAFEVEAFEFVEAGPGLALLRLAGRWPAGLPAGDPVLVAISAGERVPLSPLPAPPTGAGDQLWRAAFSAEPAHLRAAFELDPQGGAAPIPLPAPIEHGAPDQPDEEPPASDAAGPEPVPSRRFGRRRASDDQAGALEEVRRELESVRRTLALELEVVREELEASQHELASVNAHLDTVNEAHALELTAARGQRDSANERSARLDDALRAGRAQVGALRDQLADRESLIERARAEAGEASRESAELEAAAMRLHDAIAARASEAAASSGRRFARESGELERAREELRAGAERISALERQAETLREAIRSQLPETTGPSPLQEALPLDP